MPSMLSGSNGVSQGLSPCVFATMRNYRPAEKGQPDRQENSATPPVRALVYALGPPCRGHASHQGASTGSRLGAVVFANWCILGFREEIRSRLAQEAARRAPAAVFPADRNTAAQETGIAGVLWRPAVVERVCD